jgi:hypothetical protein
VRLSLSFFRALRRPPGQSGSSLQRVTNEASFKKNLRLSSYSTERGLADSTRRKRPWTESTARELIRRVLGRGWEYQAGASIFCCSPFSWTFIDVYRIHRPSRASSDHPDHPELHQHGSMMQLSRPMTQTQLSTGTRLRSRRYATEVSLRMYTASVRSDHDRVPFLPRRAIPSCPATSLVRAAGATMI